MKKIQVLLEKVMNKETFAYLVAGVLTTILNYLSYVLFCNVLGIENLIANSIAWILAVVFAYVINDRWVFQVEIGQPQLQKFIKFVGARVVTFLLEQGGMYLFINQLGFHNLVVKALLAIIIIILNYIFSKLFIFREK